MDKLSDKLELIRNEGLTEEQAERIVNAPPIKVNVPYPHSTSRIIVIVVAAIVVLILVVMLFMILKRNNDTEPWRICDRWISDKGDECVIYGYDPDNNMVRGSVLKTSSKSNNKPSNFLLKHKPQTNTFYSSTDPGVVVLSGNKLVWGQNVWQREVLYY